MTSEIENLVATGSWKVSSLLRTRRFFTGAALVQLYKAHVLSYLEYRTSAIYHCAKTSLARLDGIQKRVLDAAGLTELDALMHMNLAPLQTRRDIAMLGIIHRSVLGCGPPQFKELFVRDQSSIHFNIRSTFDLCMYQVTYFGN